MPGKIYGRVGGAGGWEIRPLAHFAIIRISRVIFRQRIPQRTGEGEGLPNHCLFPLVVLDFLSTTLLSCLLISSPIHLHPILPHLSPSHFLYLSLSLSGSYYLRLSSSHRIIPPSHTPGIDSIIPPPLWETQACSLQARVRARVRTRRRPTSRLCVYLATESTPSLPPVQSA